MQVLKQLTTRYARLQLTSTAYGLHAGQARCLVTFKDMFKSKDKKTQQRDAALEELEKQDLDELVGASEIAQPPADFEALSEPEVTRLVRVKAYKPSSDVEQIITNLCKEHMGGEFKDSQTGFKDAQQKFNILTKCIESFKHNIPNPTLNEINTVGKLVEYYSTEVKDTSTLEDLKNNPDLPKNLHINLEYNRFNPEKDTFFGGKDAYAGRDTIATSLWYSKKYKSVYKKRSWFEK